MLPSKEVNEGYILSARVWKSRTKHEKTRTNSFTSSCLRKVNLLEYREHWSQIGHILHPNSPIYFAHFKEKGHLESLI